MEKEEVIKHFCALASKVMHERFDNLRPADCFCGEKENIRFQFDREVFKFITEAVEDHLKLREKE